MSETNQSPPMGDSFGPVSPITTPQTITRPPPGTVPGLPGAGWRPAQEVLGNRPIIGSTGPVPGMQPLPGGFLGPIIGEQQRPAGPATPPVPQAVQHTDQLGAQHVLNFLNTLGIRAPELNNVGNRVRRTEFGVTTEPNYDIYNQQLTAYNQAVQNAMQNMELLGLAGGVPGNMQNRTVQAGAAATTANNSTQELDLRRRELDFRMSPQARNDTAIANYLTQNPQASPDDVRAFRDVLTQNTGQTATGAGATGTPPPTGTSGLPNLYQETLRAHGRPVSGRTNVFDPPDRANSSGVTRALTDFMSRAASGGHLERDPAAVLEMAERLGGAEGLSRWASAQFSRIGSETQHERALSSLARVLRNRNLGIQGFSGSWGSAPATGLFSGIRNIGTGGLLMRSMFPQGLPPGMIQRLRTGSAAPPLPGR